MKEKIKIQIPVVGLSKSQAKQQLEQICSEYEDEFIFEASPDEEYHIEKINSKEDIFAIMVNVEGMTRQQAEHYVYDLLVKYKNYNNMLEYKFIFLPTNNEKNQVIKLTNTDKEVEYYFKTNIKNMKHTTINISNERTKYVPYEKNVTVKEHRAPTDESVKLLHEIQEKAKEDIIAKIEIKENNLNGIIIVYGMGLEGNFAQFKFNLNGKDYIMQEKIPYEIKFEKDFSEIVKRLYKLYADEIAKQLIMESGELLKNFKL